MSQGAWIRPMLKNALWLIAILAAVFLLRECRQQGLVEGQAPALESVTLAGDAVSLEDFHGRPMLLHFWASWCSVCRFGHDSIEAIARDWPVLTVAMQSGSDAELAAFMEQQGLTAATVNDERGLLAARYGVRGVPTSFILDEAGRIRFAEIGYTTEIGLRLRLWFAKVRS